jgi:membrane-bound lytic murein transglycosylase A
MPVYSRDNRPWGLYYTAVNKNAFMEESVNLMLTRCLRGLLVVALGAAFLTGCKHQPPAKPDYGGQLKEGELALRELDPSEYPDFSVNMTDPDALIRSCDMSIKYLQAMSSERYYPYLNITHDRALASASALKQLMLDQKVNPKSPESLNALIRQMFAVYKSKGAPNAEHNAYTEKVLFTGYFTPIYDASLTREGAYQFPLYKRPADLIADPATGEVKGRKAANGTTVPYYTRAQIENSNVLAGQELVYVKSRWEAYTISIQGSAQLHLPDGKSMEIGWDGYNGYEYSSPADAMEKDGVITKEQHSAKGLKTFFAANPGLMDKYLSKNDRYIFFKVTTGGPYGALGVPVTSMASIAVDKKIDPTKNIYPRAMPAFLTVEMPMDEMGNTHAFRGFMMDQDTGGAIRAAGRCDIYMGVGPEAEKIAGHQLHEGELYYLAIKPDLIGRYMPPPPIKQPKAHAPVPPTKASAQ